MSHILTRRHTQLQFEKHLLSGMFDADLPSSPGALCGPIGGRCYIPLLVG